MWGGWLYGQALSIKFVVRNPDNFDAITMGTCGRFSKPQKLMWNNFDGRIQKNTENEGENFNFFWLCNFFLFFGETLHAAFFSTPDEARKWRPSSVFPCPGTTFCHRWTCVPAPYRVYAQGSRIWWESLPKIEICLAMLSEFYLDEKYKIERCLAM